MSRLHVGQTGMSTPPLTNPSIFLCCFSLGSIPCRQRLRYPSYGYNWGMPLTCNIDSRGKAARLIYGILMIAIGVAVAIVWAWPEGRIWQWVVAIGCVLGGAFAVFEARAGWCVVRAMGFKTPM